MNRSEQRGDLASQVRGLILVRLLVMTVLGLLLWAAGHEGFLRVSAGPPLVLLGAVWVLTLLYWAGLRFGIPLAGLVAVQIALDIALETAIVVGSGGIESPFILLYFVTTFTGAMYLGRRGAIVTACAGIVALGAVGVVIGDGTGYALERNRLIYEVCVDSAALLLLALLSGYIAERSRRTRRALQTASEELQRVMTSTDQILQSMPIGLLTASNQGTILRSNRAARELLGLDPEDDLVGQPLPQLLGTFAPQLVESVEEVLLTREWSLREEIVVETGSGPHPVGVAVTPLVHDGTVLEEVIVTLTDLHDVRHMEKEMRRSEQLATLGELAAGVAHEIRNPMASISGAVQVLRADVKAEGDEAELLDLIVRESDRLNRVIDGVLDYTRDRSGARGVHDLSAVAAEVARLIQHDQDLCEGKSMVLEFAKPHDFRAEVEEGGMKQVFFNLVRNALEAMPKGGVVRISGERPNERRIRIVFRDTGVGIPPRELEQIFKPFHTTKPDGTGLGLSIASRIVEANDGTIQVKSTPGIGTAITVELPAARVARPASPPAAEAPVPIEATG
ncbi:MAG: two-component system sensor histidine kinase NtrB [bacterium]